MLYDAVRKLMLAGLGLAAVTKGKTESVIQEWVREGELSKEEGKQLLDAWAKRVDQEKEEIQLRVKNEVNRLVASTGMVTKQDLQALEQRIAALETALQAQENKPE